MDFGIPKLSENIVDKVKRDDHGAIYEMDFVYTFCRIKIGKVKTCKLETK